MQRGASGLNPEARSSLPKHLSPVCHLSGSALAGSCTQEQELSTEPWHSGVGLWIANWNPVFISMWHAGAFQLQTRSEVRDVVR